MSGSREWARCEWRGPLAGTATPATARPRTGGRGRGSGADSLGLNRLDDMKRAQKALDAAWMKLLEPYDDWDEEELPTSPIRPRRPRSNRSWSK